MPAHKVYLRRSACQAAVRYVGSGHECATARSHRLSPSWERLEHAPYCGALRLSPAARRISVRSSSAPDDCHRLVGVVVWNLRLLASLEGFEPPTRCLEGSLSVSNLATLFFIQLIVLRSLLLGGQSGAILAPSPITCQDLS